MDRKKKKKKICTVPLRSTDIHSIHVYFPGICKKIELDGIREKNRRRIYVRKCPILEQCIDSFRMPFYAL